MGKIIANIVLTGGPCAGKTTALSKIEEYYQERGYKVLIVNESATELINGGIKPFGNQALDIFKFQEVILKYQMSKEKIYQDTALEYGENEKIIIIYDRGLIDNKAYIGQAKFDEKMLKVIESINNLIDAPTTIRRQKKYLIDLRNSDLSFLNRDNSTLIDLYQYYLNAKDSETRLRIRDYNGSKTYYITIQKKLGSGKSNVMINRKISKKVFDSLIDVESDISMIKKKRYSFTIDKQYYKLDIFDDSDYALLEVEPSKDNLEINIPNYFNVIEDVTNQSEYDNSELAKGMKKVLSRGKYVKNR